MRPSKTAAVVTAALLFTALAPSAALARPVSTYTVDWSTTTATGSVSLDLVVGDDGTGMAHFQFSTFGIVSCGSGSDFGSTLVTAHVPVIAEAFGVDRKLTSFHWSGDVDVSVSQTGCGTTVTSSEVWNLDVQGSSTDRIRRSRLDGTRLLATTLDPLTVTIDGVSYGGAGTLTEAISNG